MTSPKPHLLLAEDDANLRFVIADQLEDLGFRITQSEDGHKAWKAFQTEKFDLCLLDVMMPKMDGFELTRKIRSSDENTPIIFLTAKSLEEDKLRAFEFGADDYLTKPFSIDELGYRIKVFLRRSIVETPQLSSQKLRFGAFCYNHENYTLEYQSNVFSLTQREGELLKLLVEHENQLVTREKILVALWGENDYFKGRSLDVFISRLRKYIKDDTKVQIRNQHGVGFILVNNHFLN